MRPNTEQFALPQNWKWGFLTDPSGAKLRYGHGAPSGEIKAIAIIAVGFGEFVEKYGELIQNLYDRQIEVWILDWRGQGGSTRFLKEHPQRLHAVGFAQHVTDLKKFIYEVAKRKPDLPVILFGHSMGGHLALRYLHDHPDIVDAAILTAPMMGIYLGGMPLFLAKALTCLAVFLGFSRLYVPGGEDWREDRPTFAERQGFLSHCPVRGTFQREFLKKHPKLRTGSATFGWLSHAFRSLKTINNADYLWKIRTPTLFFVPEKDKIVLPQAGKRAASLMPQAHCVMLPDSKHEPWMEVDTTRHVLLQELDSFLKRILS